MMPLIIGLTGGIGSGKSTVAHDFAQLGVPIIDADVIARNLLEPEQPAYQQVVTHFGSLILSADKQIDRAQLRHCIFSDPAERQWLEQMLHPLILQQMQQQCAQVISPYAIAAIPLLAEIAPIPFIDRVLVVDAPLAQQIARTCERDHISIEAAQRIIENQASSAQRLRLADDIIENDGSLTTLHQQVRKYHDRYLQLAMTHTSRNST